MAQKVSPAIFSLDDEGHIGIRTVSAADVVEYHIVEIVRDDTDGVWVTGLPEIATVITVGQEMVVPGQRVQVTYEPSTTLPASTAPADANQPRERDGEARNTPVTVARETFAVRPDPSPSSTPDATSNRI